VEALPAAAAILPSGWRHDEPANRHAGADSLLAPATAEAVNDRGCRECDRLFRVLVATVGEIIALEMQSPVADGALQAAMGLK
jgi:hypothetical protein